MEDEQSISILNATRNMIAQMQQQTINVSITFKHKGHTITLSGTNNPDILLNAVESIKKEKILTDIYELGVGM